MGVYNMIGGVSHLRAKRKDLNAGACANSNEHSEAVPNPRSVATRREARENPSPCTLRLVIRRGATLAQLVEQRFCKAKVRGSSPRGGSEKIDS